MLDRKLVKSVATETLLMMGKSIPVAGKGIELWQAVSAQRERAGNAERIAELEARLSRFERKQQALAAETMQQVLAELRSDASHQARHDALQDLHDMKQAGYLVGAFEGLIQRSPHYQSIQQTPQAFGTLLEPGDTLDPTAVPVFVSFDGKPRILQIPLFTLENLLTPIDNAQTLTAGSDVWGLPEEAAAPTRPPAQDVLESLRAAARQEGWHAAHRKYSHTAVAAAQTALGIDVDGIIGGETLETIQRFQMQSGACLVDGLLGPETFSLLAAAYAEGPILLDAPAAKPQAQQQPGAGVSSERLAILYNRKRNYPESLIREIQSRIGADPDGVFGSGTVRQLRTWQKAQGLDPDGKAGPGTLRRMGLLK